MTQSTLRDPWFSIWREPRETIREIVTTYANKYDLHLAAVAGIAHMLSWASEKELANRFSLVEILLICIFAGPIYGYIFLNVSSFSLWHVSRFTGGKGRLSEVKTAVAWASIPVIWSLVMWIPVIAIWGEKCFQKKSVITGGNLFLALPALLLAFASFYYLYKVFYIFIQSIAEVLQISTFKSIVTILLAYFIIILVSVSIAFLFAFLFGFTTFSF